MVYSIPNTADSTAEELIQRMIEGIRRMIRVNNNDSQQEEPELKISSATKRHFELQIETLQNAPRNEGKFRQLLILKEKQNGEATRIEDTQRLVTERLKC